MKPFVETLKIGSEGELVSDLQQRLVDLHFDRCQFDDGSIGIIEVNGIFGEVTQEALKDFQQKVIDTVDKANIDEVKAQKDNHPIVLGEFDYYTWYVLNNLEGICSYYKIELIPDDYGVEDRTEEEPIEEPVTELVSRNQMKKVFMCSDKTINKHYDALNKILKDYNITTPLRIQHFMAQVGHESCGLKYMQEIASGAAYEGRADLGNIYTGDGKRFKGRGPIQLTGRHNYTMYFNSIGRPELIETPEILETDMELCWGATAWYWKTRKLNVWADKDDVREITRRVNGGFNGLADRKEYLKRAKQCIF